MPCLSVGSNFFFLYVQIVLDKFKLVWTGPICFRPDQKQLFTTEVHMAKTYGLVQNNLDLTNIALELTLSQPWGGGTLCPHITTGTPGLADLPTALACVSIQN